MADRIPFLTARWSNLALLTYQLDPQLLQPLVPPGCELDLRDGYAFASLVAFDFLETRVLGVAWPGFVNFPEVNLRFYVRHRTAEGIHRGVCFVREIVPQRTIAGIARWIYNEPYIVAPMQSRVLLAPPTISIEHSVTWKGRINTLQITADSTTVCPTADSIECFFKEHEWGFNTSRSGRLIRYKVVHPIWNIHPIQQFKLDWDWVGMYGSAFAPLQAMTPMSVILAEGSKVKVFPYGKMPRVQSSVPSRVTS